MLRNSPGLLRAPIGLGLGLAQDVRKKRTSVTEPTAVSLSASSVREDAATGTVVATISSNATGEAAIYAITADPDGKFSVSGDRLVLAVALDHETATQHQVEISATNKAGSHAEIFSIAVTDAAETTAPTAIGLSASAVSEDAAVGSVVALISADGTPAPSFSIIEAPADINLSTTSVQEDVHVGSVVAIISSDDPEAVFSLV